MPFVVDQFSVPLFGANVFESTSDGIIISGGFYAETDVLGYYPTPGDVDYITASYVTVKTTVPGDDIPDNIVIQTGFMLDGVTITAKPTPPPSKIPWETIALILTIAATLITITTFIIRAINKKKKS